MVGLELKCYFKYVIDKSHNQQVMLSCVDLVLKAICVTY